MCPTLSVKSSTC
ncbi:rCG49354 [Rattus norvegicus]|uniref:RCG49354 n=1 Tax=Rattus norvegicus TaxID=10116 RepID=A6J300_RAT|nr:rCG49354 [Rattus norvegicus]